MIKSYSADYILPVSSAPIKNGVISVDELGTIIGLHEQDDPEVENLSVEKLEGILVPGFVNSHCHLELSHHAKKFEKDLGLIPFIKKVIASRSADENTVAAAIVKADEEMIANGIVAVGDISNNDSSIPVKQNSKLYYHTFVELLCFEPEKVKQVFKEGLELKEKFNPLPSSLVPHAAYSACKDLFKYLSHFCTGNGNILSIHNQESEDENKLFRYKTGGFIEFYESMKMDISFFKPQARNSIQSTIPMLPDNQKVILVHNTYTSMKDLHFIRRFGYDLGAISWCFCPNANLYIEGKLPKIDLFLSGDYNVILGTDSLASNDQLCILSELKTIARYFPQVPLTQSIAWATLNGAKALEIADRFGSLEVGKTPGLNLVSNTHELKLSEDSRVRKIV